MTLPITPQQAKEKKLVSIPAEVIEAFNEMIVAKLNNGYATFRQQEVVELIQRKMPDVFSEDIYDNHWLDVEPLYVKAGWTVKYDQPAYNESYPATFTFSYGK